MQAARELGGERFVVKAQIHAGGRGKAGGVKLAEGLSGVEQAAGEILGKTLVTPQTGPSGKARSPRAGGSRPSPSHTNTISPS